MSEENSTAAAIPIRCSFCSLASTQVRVLVVSDARDCAICDRCAEIANLAIGDYWREKQIANALRPFVGPPK